MANNVVNLLGTVLLERSAKKNILDTSPSMSNTVFWPSQALFWFWIEWDNSTGYRNTPVGQSRQGDPHAP